MKRQKKAEQVGQQGTRATTCRGKRERWKSVRPGRVLMKWAEATELGFNFIILVVPRSLASAPTNILTCFRVANRSLGVNNALTKVANHHYMENDNLMPVGS